MTVDRKTIITITLSPIEAQYLRALLRVSHNLPASTYSKDGLQRRVEAVSQRLFDALEGVVP